MATKSKIIAGFLFMIALLVGMAALGYERLQSASENFVEFRRLSHLSVDASDLVAAFGVVVTETYHFTDSRDPKYIDKMHRALDEARRLVKDTSETMRAPDRQAMLKKIDENIEVYQSTADQMQADILSAYAQYVDVVRKNADSMTDSILTIGAQARGADNVDALYELSQAWDSIALARGSLARFAESRSLQDGKEAKGFLAILADQLAKVNAMLRTDEGKQLFGLVMQSYAKVAESVDRMEALYQRVENSMTKLQSIRDTLTDTAAKLSTDVDRVMRENGGAVLAAEAGARQMMLILSGIGLVIGLLCAFVIIHGIIRVLGECSGFAEAVARGDFSYTLRVTEKGEIGAMVEAMRHIPVTLGRVMGETKTLANNISTGRFRDRIDEASFAGSFAELAKSVNFVGDTFTNVLDKLPAPLMACEKSNSILFLNQAAQRAIGGNHIGAKCGDHMKAAECNNKNCFGACAMSGNTAYAGETTIHPQGRRVEIAVAVQPLHDIAGTITGFMEVITDITEIKDRQETMRGAAKSASEISDRVAAASEELSAQVEQISHGAERQRDRVSSTAAAMEEMNATVLEVARNASRASEQSDSSRQKAEDGAKLVNQVVAAINSVNTVAVTLQENMHELGKLAEDIGGVMNVISDIADQTNLLALNAAIEAARAGEAGRGFAVVADEVRKLAEKTMSATQEVGSSITAIQNSARTNIDEVGTAVSNIGAATSLANSSGTALTEIVDLAAASSAVVTSIATAAEEQSATSEEINRAIEEINHVVGETTVGMVESSAAVRELSRMAQELRVVISSLH